MYNTFFNVLIREMSGKKRIFAGKKCFTYLYIYKVWKR